MYGQCNAIGVQQQLKLALSTKILATVKLIGHFNHTVVTLGLLWYQHRTSARQLVQTSSLTILGTSTMSLQLHHQGDFHAVMATGDSLTDV